MRAAAAPSRPSRWCRWSPSGSARRSSCPTDGKNLNRTFPGDPDGSYTDRLAHDIFTRLIEPADALLDLHGGDLVEALEPFALYADEPSRDIALAFGLPYVVGSTDALAGMTATAAANAGVPAIIAEAGGIGQLEEPAVALLADGTRSALRHLGALAGRAEPPRSRDRRRLRVAALRARRLLGGARSGPATRSRRARCSARCATCTATCIEEVRAPAAGVLLFLTTSAAVADDGLLLGLGTDIA